ncbi:hypothetical protein SAMN05518683_11229 [Salibacterium halotolerans]|uniref:YwdI family protein n=2 Tax=Salibacterium halotolerans TaxID=1884432 RepID=A0A1I5U1N6_9BACI|nr:hypothetical protein SAMN05518683_11229 [Salibacterium halotolerans]
MYIPAKTVVEKMEEEMMALSDRLDREDEDAVKHHARVIKAYCDILTGEQEQPAQKNAGRTASVAPSAGSGASPAPKPSSSPTEDVPSTEGNLLDF